MSARGREALTSWILAEGLTGGSMADLLAGTATRLVAGGMKLSRASIGLPTISPEFRAVEVKWLRDGEATRERVEHDRFPGAFDTSPIAFLLKTDRLRHRWRIGRDGPDGYRLLQELREGGHTDYVVHLVSFAARTGFAVQGVALTACSDDPDGFADEDVALLAAIAQPLGLAAYRIALFDITADVLGAYLGHESGLRVLKGEIRRGHGERIEGALMMADLAGFTAVAETGGEALVARLGEHLAAMVEPIEAAGGEVLKFMGDGILAGFPIAAKSEPVSSCAAALSAAREAIALNAAVNRRHAGEPPLWLDVGLHRGEMFYGNVGAGSRLDFTVIGPAVNEAARLETLCGTVGHRLLMSEPFARSCGRTTVSLGYHRLKGVAEPREVFTLTEP